MASRAPSTIALPLLAAFAALTSLATGCQSEEYGVFLTVRSDTSIDQLTVRTIMLDPDNPRSTPPSVHTIGRSQEEINGDLPIRVTVAVGSPREIMIHLEGISPTGTKFVATRCYPVGGIIEDAVRLVPLANDRDGDGFIEDPSEACVGPEGDPCGPTYPYQCSALQAGDCHERPASPDEMDCDPGPDGSVRVPCDRTVDPATGCCDPPQDTYPGAPELCNDGIDQSCNQLWAPDDNGGDVACTDEDEDGFAKCSPFSVVGTCDCNDDDPSIRPMRAAETRTPCEMRPADEQADCDPGAPLECENSRDEDCDGVDARCDLDGDGFGTDNDCNDADPTINRGAMEVCTPTGGTPVDEDCNGLIDELATCAPDDQDRDGSVACEVSMVAGCDCNDCDSGINATATEVCGDGIDQDCDGSDLPCDPLDGDRDGFLPPARDCDDTNPSIHTGAPEQCTGGVDDDCDGMIDEGCASDADMDGWVESAACDMNAAVNPGADEVCDDLDNDCNEIVNEVYSEPDPMMSGAYPDGTLGCILCPVGTAAEWCDVDITGADESELAKRLSFQNCGGCRVACDAVETDDCGDGTCVCSFNGNAPCTGSRCCASGCEELDDPANCGACGSDCNAGRPASRPAADNCIDGGCACGTGSACGAGFMCCGGGCVAFDDPRFCGACGSSCFDMPGNPADQNCVETTPSVFQCVCSDSNQDNCDGNDAANGCETNLNDPTSIDNCGGCGIRCRVRNGTPTCNTGTCAISSCDANHDDCNRTYSDGCETDLRTLANCGVCGSTCATAHATPTCATRSCEIQSCDTGWGDCNGGPGNGCETPLNTLTNCGSCGSPCSRANATATCTTRSCRIASCNAGWGNCDGNDANGCETRLNSLTNCGACGTSCSRANATATCTTGSCAISSCNTNFDNCNGSDPDGCEASLTTDTRCGSCTNSCSLPETCMGTSCNCTPRTSCTGGQDCGTQSDGCFGTLNCGSCSGLDQCIGNMCTCVPRTSCTGGANCGTQADGCGGTLNCGSCSGLDQCMAGMCVCVPRTTCTGGANCGTQDDGCGGTLNCGSCSGLDQCMAGMCVCVPRTTCTGGQDCGTQDDGCGGTLNCGTCGGADMCCSDMCVNTNNSDAHCGMCGMACTGGETCSGGTCS